MVELFRNTVMLIVHQDYVIWLFKDNAQLIPELKVESVIGDFAKILTNGLTLELPNKLLFVFKYY